MVECTVLITGCSSGIGHETARAFRDRGWTVYATDSDPTAMADLERIGCETAQLDVTEPDDPAAVVERIDDERDRLDCLFNNAGYGQIGPLEELPTPRLREQFEVNVFGHHRLVRAALPLLRRQGDGTVINMASVYGRTVFPGQGAYAASKWAVEGFSDTLRTEVEDFGIDVVVVEPGPVETDFGNRALAEKEDLERTGAYGWFDTLYDPEKYDRRFLDRGVGYVQPRRVAEVIVEAAESDDPKRRYVVGPWKYLLLAGYVVPDAVRDRFFDLLKRLP